MIDLLAIIQHCISVMPRRDSSIEEHRQAVRDKQHDRPTTQPQCAGPAIFALANFPIVHPFNQLF